MTTDEARMRIYNMLVSSYVGKCQAKKVKVPDWRDKCEAFKPPSCPQHSHWSACGSACPLTCADKPGVPKVCVKKCVEQCVCDEGFVLSGDTCVKYDTCGCVDSERDDDSKPTNGYFPLGHK